MAARKMTCDECSRTFTAHRSDALTCGAACRNRRYRRAKHERAAVAASEAARAARLLAAQSAALAALGLLTED